MKRKVYLHNIVLKTTAFIMTVALLASAFLFNVSALFPVVSIVSSLWLLAFGYANGWLDGDDE